MCKYVRRLDEISQCESYYCTDCALEGTKFRLVKVCWRPGCMKSCDSFDTRCIPENSTDGDKEVVKKTASILSVTGLLKIIEHIPGKCFSCSGSGLAQRFDAKFCSVCHGSGICTKCNGKYQAARLELSQSEIPREW